MFNRINPAHFVFFSQGVTVLYGASFLLLVPFVLTPLDQGVWFTMLGLGAMSRLADMGFMSLLLTYTGYTRSNSFEYSFNDVYLFSELWRNKVIKIIFPFIFVLGALILSSYKSVNVDMALSWLLYVISLAVLFYSVHKIAIIEGLGLVRQAHFFRGAIYFLAMLFTIIGLYYSSSTYALGGGLLASLSINLLFITYYFNGQKLKTQRHGSASRELQGEFIVLLKKTAGSWIGGYVGTHAIIPLIYLLVGPVISGLAGVTLNIFLALQNFSNSFMVAKVPDITYLIAKRKYVSAQTILKSSFIKSLCTFMLFSLIIWGAYYLYFEKFFSGRLLDGYHLSYLFIGFLFQIFISAIAIYIRAHKKELFSYMSIFTGILGMLILFVVVDILNNELYFLGFFISSFIALFWAIKILQMEKQCVE